MNGPSLLPVIPETVSATNGAHEWVWVSLDAFSVYNVDVYAKGYTPAFFNNVPIFSGINSVQPAILVPSVENAQYNITRNSPGTPPTVINEEETI